ncbi:MAG: ABC transporter ATP-binding protein [Caldiserica bacterium]|nr:MAG: ABC transporter ATP-binding protein [Caldisericota bacterium]RLD14882.1 MAG: ABC transporter ATP-binding protein [Caldisericota bacterium]HDD57637.1 ABC transporter ATP-binding protein [Thermoplasmatales archaeon]
MAEMLRMEHVTTVYGVNKMLIDVSIKVDKGKCVSLLGSNGAGKSTLIKAILGLVKVVEGKIYFEGKDITHYSTHRVISLGISIAPEGKRIFPKLTVLENLRMGAYLVKEKEEIERRLEELVFPYFPRLKERLNQVAGTLSGGEQSMLNIGRALMGNPKLMIFDEPSFGLAPILIQETAEIIKKINREKGITVLLVEQNANMALEITHYGYFLQKGQIIAEGTPEELKKQEIIRKAYF